MSAQSIVLAGGCFWCVEAVFLDIIGVESVVSAYTGGSSKNPSYEAICTGTTGHAEVVALSYDDSVISLPDLLRIFFTVHDPTTLNRQGHDAGTQYRSAIFYSSQAQLDIAKSVIDQLKQDKIFYDEIVTTLEPLGELYEAEEYHQNYFAKNPDNAYCRASIAPKSAKIVENFAEFLRG